jgi:hypothetical protein
LKLDQWFPDLDRDLIELAMIMNLECKEQMTPKRRELLERLEDTYGIIQDGTGNKCLAFYGDLLLDVLIIDRCRLNFGLDITNTILNKVREDLASNKVLKQISIDLRICTEVLGVKNPSLVAKNECCEAMEGILGALYFKFGIAGIERIKKWWYSLEPVNRVVDTYLIELRKKREADLFKTGYFPTLEWNVNDNVNNFLDQYLSRYNNFELYAEYAGDEYNDIYLENKLIRRKYYIGTIMIDDKQGLKQALIDKKIWIPQK